MVPDTVRENETRTRTLLLAYVALLYFGSGAGLFEPFLNGPLLVVPFALRVPITVALLWRRPGLFPRWVVLIALAAHGFSDERFARLIATDRPFRVLPLVCEAVAELWMLRRVVEELAASPRTTPQP